MHTTEVDMLKRLMILPLLVILACAGRVREPSEGSQAGKQPVDTRELSQVVVYARLTSPITLPLLWEIRKISLNTVDGRQIDIPGSESSLSLSGMQHSQSLLAVSEIEAGSYTGVTFFTREVYSEISGQPVSFGSKAITVGHSFTIVGGNSKTLTLLVDLEYSGSPETAKEFMPSFSMQPEDPSPPGKLVYVANEDGANISVIDKSLKYVVYNVFVGTKPYALGADQRRRRLYIADRKDGVIYEMDTVGNRLVRATEIEFVDEPVHIEPVGEEDMLLVLNYGSNSAYVMDAFSSRIIETVEVSEDPMDAVYSSLYNLAFVVSKKWGMLSVLDFSSRPVMVDTTFRVEREPIGIAIDDTEEWLFISSSGSIDLTVFEIRRMGIERTVTVGLGAGDIAFDPFGRRLYICMMDTEEVLCLDPFTGVMFFRVGLPSSPGKIIFEKDEKMVYVTVPGHNAVAVIDPMTQRIEHWIETGLRPSSIAVRY
jgi:DNA-binding beta-propeller fold protein YncE